MSDPVESDEVVNNGKTKSVLGVEDDFHHVIVENKDDITKDDDSSKTEQMASKAEYATATTSAVFEVLNTAGIPTAFVKRLSPTKFLAKRCKMINLEVIGRRYAVGSFLKRSPNLAVAKGEPPHRFHNWKFELFLKTTGSEIIDKDGNHLGDLPVDVLRDDGKHIDDPFIVNPYDAEEWILHHPKIPLWNKEDSYLGYEIDPSVILPEGVTVDDIEKIQRQIALILESLFAQFGVRFIDFKIEFGITTNGKLVVSDVIDNDSWRARDSDWLELSKQLFRDNADMALIQDKFELMAKLVQNFRIPKQAIVLWRGSESDDFPDVPEIEGVDVVAVTISGHKSPKYALRALEELLADYPEGGVILPIVGMSNGLGPILTARTSWPVIAIPATVKKRPHDVWSSLEVPSNVPLVTVLNPKNAVLAALNILAQKNPVAYMARQYDIETLDD